jgi:hypothetical protein
MKVGYWLIRSGVPEVARLVHLRLDILEQVVWRIAGREATPVCDSGDFRSDVLRDLADARQCRIEATLCEVRFGHELRERVRCGGDRHQKIMGWLLSRIDRPS